MRALLVADNVPWPPLGGGLVRLAQVVEAVASVTDLDLFVLHNQDRTKVEVPPAISVLRSKGVQNPRTSSTVRWRLEWAARRGLPVEVVMARADRAPGVALRDWARPPYDVVWFSTARSYEWLGRPELGPDHCGSGQPRGRQGPVAGRLVGGPAAIDRACAALFGHASPGIRPRLNGSDWRRFQRSVAAQVERVVIASDLDAARSGLSNVTRDPQHIPAAAAASSGIRPPAGPLLLLFQGNLGYPPNIDAAQWLATAIAPLVRVGSPGGGGTACRTSRRRT